MFTETPGHRGGMREKTLKNERSVPTAERKKVPQKLQRRGILSVLDAVERR